MDFVDWIKKKYQGELPAWLLVVGFVLSATFYVSSKSFDAKLSEPFLSSKWFLAALGDIGGIIVTAIVAGGVLKVLSTQKYFTDALSSVIYGEKGLDQMLPEERLRIWKALTRRIYVPSIHESIDQHQINSLYENIAEAAGEQLNYKESFFIRQMRRELTFFPHPTDPSRIVMKDFMTASLIPFDPSKSICWSSKRNTTNGNNIALVPTFIETLTIEGEDASKRKTEVSEDGTSETITYTLAGKKNYDILRDRTQSWSIVDDPHFSLLTGYVVWEGYFRIENKVPGLKIIFRELGGKNIFSIMTCPGNEIREGIDFRRGIGNVMLPRRGFLLTFVVDPPPP